jgi:hypothetical protein
LRTVALIIEGQLRRLSLARIEAVELCHEVKPIVAKPHRGNDCADVFAELRVALVGRQPLEMPVPSSPTFLFWINPLQFFKNTWRKAIIDSVVC